MKPHRINIRSLLLATVMAGVSNWPILATSRVGETISDFSLQDASGGPMAYAVRDHRITVVIFVSTRCPMSNAFNSRINSLYRDLAGRSVRFFVINANANESIEEVRSHAVRVGYDFPVYKDVNDVVADVFGAVATPEAFVVDENGMVRYHGIVEDGANPERTTMRPLRSAVEALLQHKEVPVTETHGRGCAIRRLSYPH